MPLYEYQCDACGRRFERIQKFSDPPIEICPTCGGKVHKLVSSPAFQFKGTGWYVTDYSRKDKGGAESEKASGPSSTSGSSDADKGSKDTKDAKDSSKDTKTSAGSTDSAASPSSTAPTTPSKS